MATPFSENKDTILIAFYRFIRESDGQIWITAQDLEPFCPHNLSRSFIQLTLQSLEKGSFVDGEEDKEGHFETFSLTEKGILQAEKVVGARGLWPEFENLATSVNEVIEIKDDAPAAAEIREKIDELQAVLDTGNDIGDMTEADVESAKVELAALRRFYEGAKVRAGVVAQQARQTLGWIAKKAGETTVSELAKKLIGLILNSLGYGG